MLISQHLVIQQFHILKTYQNILDYKEKKVGIGKVIYPSGNIKKDMQIIQDFYKTITPKYPELYNPVIF